jgi:MFS family permease
MSDPHHHATDEKPGWVDRPGVRRMIVGALVVVSLVAAALGFVPAFQKEEPHFPVESLHVFFAVWGFACFMFIVLAGQHLRKLVGRNARYYDERE